MTGLFLTIFLALTVLFFLISIVDDYNSGDWRGASVIAGVIFILYVLAIPLSRIDSKTNVEYIKTVQLNLDTNRENEQELNALERINAFEEMNDCNSRISSWKIKGNKWYNNKWYLHTNTQDAVLVK